MKQLHRLQALEGLSQQLIAKEHTRNWELYTPCFICTTPIWVKGRPVRPVKTYVSLTLHERTKPQSSLRKTPPSKWNVLCPVSKCCFANPLSPAIRYYWDIWFHTLPSSSVLPTNNNAQNKCVWKSWDHLIKRNVIVCHYF